MKFEIVLNNYTSTTFTMKTVGASIYAETLVSLQDKRNIYIDFEGSVYVIPSESILYIRKLPDESS